MICNRSLDYVFIFTTPNQTHIKYKERGYDDGLCAKAFFAVVVVWCLSCVCVANFNMTAIFSTVLKMYMRVEEHHVQIYVCGQYLG